MDKIEELSKILEDNQGILIKDLPNRFYLTNFNSSEGLVLITKKGAYFLVDFRYYEKAKNTVTNFEVILSKNVNLQIGKLLNDDCVSEVLIGSENITVSDFEYIKNNLKEQNVVASKALSKKLKSIRSIKSAKEIELIKKSQEITDKTFSYILSRIDTSRTEKEIMLDMEFFMRREGSEGIAFDFIVVSGKNSSLPHGVPTDKKIEKGDFITMDFGAVYGGYRSDMTRTVAVGGVTDEQKNIYETVLKAQNAAFEKIGPDIACFEVDKAARNIIDAAGYGDCFGHALGHSLGVEIHEQPNCNPKDKTLMKSGMVMTVEPGIYIENRFGVRIENMALVTDNGYENLTHSPKNLIII